MAMACRNKRKAERVVGGRGAAIRGPVQSGWVFGVALRREGGEGEGEEVVVCGGDQGSSLSALELGGEGEGRSGKGEEEGSELEHRDGKGDGSWGWRSGW